MSVLLRPSQFNAVSREITTGIVVHKNALTLADGEQTLFTITGGRVIVSHIVGEVTVAATVANAAKLVFDPDAAGSDVDLCTTLDIGTTDSAVGSYFTITGTVANAMVKTVQYGPTRMAQPLTLSEGAIHLNNGGTGVDGAIAWSLIYVPFDAGAEVVAA